LHKNEVVMSFTYSEEKKKKFLIRGFSLFRGMDSMNWKKKQLLALLIKIITNDNPLSGTDSINDFSYYSSWNTVFQKNSKTVLVNSFNFKITFLCMNKPSFLPPGDRFCKVMVGH
jgi:hypothetical protein